MILCNTDIKVMYMKKEEQGGERGKVKENVIHSRIWSFRPNPKVESIISEIMRIRGIDRTEAIHECIELIPAYFEALEYFEKGQKLHKEGNAEIQKGLDVLYGAVKMRKGVAEIKTI